MLINKILEEYEKIEDGRCGISRSETWEDIGEYWKQCVKIFVEEVQSFEIMRDGSYCGPGYLHGFANILNGMPEEVLRESGKTFEKNMINLFSCLFYAGEKMGVIANSNLIMKIINCSEKKDIENYEQYKEKLKAKNKAIKVMLKIKTGKYESEVNEGYEKIKKEYEEKKEEFKKLDIQEKDNNQRILKYRNLEENFIELINSANELKKEKDLKNKEMGKILKDDNKNDEKLEDERIENNDLVEEIHDKSKDEIEQGKEQEKGTKNKIKKKRKKIQTNSNGISSRKWEFYC